MIDFKLNPYLHKKGISTNFLYHGSPIIINDNNMASGTFFTIDKNIAKDYGKFIYSIELNEKIATIFHPDVLREHLVSCCLIPMYMFDIEECNQNNEKMTNQGEMTVSGIIKAIGPEQQVSASYSKREVVVTTDEQHPQHILIEFSQGKCKTELDKMGIGTNVIVSINLKGREWVNPQGETKYFNTIQGWKISQRTA